MMSGMLNNLKKDSGFTPFPGRFIAVNKHLSVIKIVFCNRNII